MNSANRLWLLLLLCGAVGGCSKAKVDNTAHINLVPTVAVKQPELRDVHRRIAQPGMIESYEQTAIFSKISGFVQKWYVDIGARVEKDQLLVELLVPELADEHAQKQAQVEQRKAMVQQAERQVSVAESNVQSAVDAVAEAQASISRYQADVDRWKGELDRLTGLVKDNVVNPEVLAETQNQFKASQSAYEAAGAAVKSKDSQRLAAEALVEKAKADLTASRAEVKVAEAEERRLGAMLEYTKITAPYDGVITSRNVNTGDFVRAGTGEANDGHDGEGRGGRSNAMFVVTRTDPVMFVIGVPEVDAPYVSVGTKASLRLQALANREFDVEVSRIAPTLNKQSRTLQAEIDLPNQNGEMLPGMYAYGSIELDRPNVRAIPCTSTVQIGNRMCCYLVSDSKAVRTQIQTGVSDDTWVEVVKKKTYPINGEAGAWEDFDGTEKVIVGDLSEMSDGKQVAVAGAKQTEGTQVLKLSTSPGTQNVPQSHANPG